MTNEELKMIMTDALATEYHSTVEYLKKRTIAHMENQYTPNDMQELITVTTEVREKLLNIDSVISQITAGNPPWGNNL